MDTNQTQELFCRGCGEPFQNGAICCSLCGLQLNEEPDTIEIGLVEKVKVEIEEKNDQLLIGANAAYGTKDWSVYNKRLDRLDRLDRLKRTFEPSNPVDESDGLEQLMVLFQKIVANPDQKFTLLDDNPDRLTLATISNEDGVINASFSECPWEEAFDNNRGRRLCQLLAGYEAPTTEWFSRNVASKIDPKTQLVHTSVYRNASHSQTIDELIRLAYPNTTIENLVYLSDQNFIDLINCLCVTAPLKEEIKVLSAQIGQNGAVKYNEVLVFPKDQFIEQDNEVTISVKSNTVSNKTSKLIFFKGKWASEQTMYEYDLEVEPGQTKKCSLKLANRRLDGITADSNKVKTVAEIPEMPKTVDVSRRRVEVFLILDTIVFNEETFIDRKKIVEDLIDEIGKYDQQIDIIFHLYSYSCDCVPAYSRPRNWPNEYTEFSGNLENTKRSLQSLKMSRADAHIFPGRLDLVFKAISGHTFSEENTSYCLFIIGNRPASPEKDMPKIYGVSTNWRSEWEKIKSKFSLIQVIHDDSFIWPRKNENDPPKKGLPEKFQEHYDDFWNTVQPGKRLLNWSVKDSDEVINKHLCGNTVQNNQLTIPIITVEKG